MSGQYEECWSHTSECDQGMITDQDRLKAAYGAVADELVRMAKLERKQDLYAGHVTEQAKDEYLQSRLDAAEKVRSGETTANDKSWLWQMINHELTGVMVPVFSCED